VLLCLVPRVEGTLNILAATMGEEDDRDAIG
jgi:hypothetical protein